jgi:integrase
MTCTYCGMGRCQRCLAESGHRPRRGRFCGIFTWGNVLQSAPDPPTTKYVAPVRGYLTWLAASDRDVETDGDPLDEPAGRDGAVRDWCAWVKTIARLRPATINNTLAAIDDFYTRRGLGAATARREALPRRVPKALSNREVLHYLRAVEHCASTRDTVVALLPFYAGLRISEVVDLDLDEADVPPEPT